MLRPSRARLLPRLFGGVRDRRDRRELARLRGEWWGVIQDPEQRRKIETAIGKLETTYLIGLVRRYRLPEPSLTRADLWEGPELQIQNGKVQDKAVILTRGARTEYQSAIQAYRKERRETWRLWITTVVPTLTGFIGVIVALIALLLGRR